MSMKFSFSPLLQVRFDFLQFKHVGTRSSHLRCLSLHVRQPVRTRFGFGSSVGGVVSALAMLLVCAATMASMSSALLFLFLDSPRFAGDGFSSEEGAVFFGAGCFLFRLFGAV